MIKMEYNGINYGTKLFDAAQTMWFELKKMGYPVCDHVSVQHWTVGTDNTLEVYAIRGEVTICKVLDRKEIALVAQAILDDAFGAGIYDSNVIICDYNNRHETIITIDR